MTAHDMKTSNFLEASAQIGWRVADDAIWHEDRCNWVGAEPLERHPNGYRGALTYKALGPDLYAGTSGIVLFLAELFAVTRQTILRRTALGALRQSLGRLESIPPAARLGLFSGWTGIALVAVRAAILFNHPALLDEAKKLICRIADEQYPEDEYDLISGRAGAIAALVALHAVLGDFSLLDFAARLGDELVESAARSTAGYSWHKRNFGSYRNLTGFSHGAAGAAYALLELHAATGAIHYREAALRAFDYERSCYVAERQNWPDFRKDPSRSSRKPRSFPCLSYWCHGAPGIALARLRAYELGYAENAQTEAVIALATTRISIDSAMSAGAGNYSLCHGLAGNAEALLYGAEILGRDIASDTVAFESAASAIERYTQSGSAWPCGTHVAESPGLMLGLAGIGHHLLRLHEPSVPSIAILRKEQWHVSRQRINQEEDEFAMSASVLS